MSKEHFWPDWLNPYFPKSSNDKHGRAFYSSPAKSPLVLKRKIERPGNLITKKFRVVCETCNNGWMSRLEEKVKPVLLSIIKNKCVTINEETLSLLSRWIVMKVIVGEQSEDGTQVTPESDRKMFYESSTIPDYFRVYISRHKTQHKTAYLRHAVTLALSLTGPIPPLGGMKKNTQTVGIVIGSLFVFVTASRVDSFELENRLNLKWLRRIYPNTGGEVQWDTVAELGEREISAVLWALNDLTLLPNIKYGGPLPSH